MVATTYLIEMTTDRCEQLVASSTLGRLAIVVKGRPEIFPVGHVWDDETKTILFPSNQETKWHAALDWPWVAFEVDGFDADDAEGWSVAVVGQATEVDDAAVIDRALQRRVMSGFLGPNVRWLGIVPAKMTGWRIVMPTDVRLPG